MKRWSTWQVIFSDLNALLVSHRHENYDAMDVNNNNEMFGKKGYWIVDSGATCHMTCMPEKLSNISENNKNTGRKVYLPNGQITLVTHSGSCMIPDGGALVNVLVVPEFKHDLLSVSQLTRQLKCSVHFFPEFCIFQDLFNGKVKGIGKEFEGLYYFPSAYQTKANDDAYTVNKRCLLTKTDSQSLRWHYRMGHLSFRVLKELYKDATSYACNNCPICPLAKQTKLPFPISVSRTNVVFDLIHVDVWGPYRYATHNGFRYFIFVDDK